MSKISTEGVPYKWTYLLTYVCADVMHQIDRKSHRNKDTLSPLNEVLLRLKPSTFKDNYLASFKV